MQMLKDYKLRNRQPEDLDLKGLTLKEAVERIDKGITIHCGMKDGSGFAVIAEKENFLNASDKASEKSLEEAKKKQKSRKMSLNDLSNGEKVIFSYGKRKDTETRRTKETEAEWAKRLESKAEKYDKDSKTRMKKWVNSIKRRIKPEISPEDAKKIMQQHMKELEEILEEISASKKCRQISKKINDLLRNIPLWQERLDNYKPYNERIVTDAYERNEDDTVALIIEGWEKGLWDETDENEYFG